MGRYVALSYCWGGPQPVTLMTDTYEQMTGATGIELSTLPLTIQDAVKVTRGLGLRYLWIDAICILQDNPEDKKRELEHMAWTYKNAYITVSAASAESCQDGFLQYRTPRKSRYPRFELPYRAWEDDSATMGTVILQESHRHDALQEPVNRRAWCLQERLLSPRFVAFGTHELIWQCRELGQQESATVAGGSASMFDAGTERLPPAFFDQTRSVSRNDLFDMWIDVVIDYSWRSLSFEGDKLIAISAIASEFQKLNDGDAYFAGLWRRDLVNWLTWIVDPSQLEPRKPGVLKPRPSQYVAPSWTWASVNSVVSFGSAWWETDFFSEVLRCETLPQDADLPTGAVTGGVLEIRGPLKKTRWLGQTLFDGPDAESKALGKAFMDADEDKPDIISCLRITQLSGLIVAIKSQDPDTYKRVGYFEISAKQGAVCAAWFAGSELQTITIV